MTAIQSSAKRNMYVISKSKKYGISVWSGDKENTKFKTKEICKKAMYVNEMQPTQLIQYPFFPSFGIKEGGHFHGCVKQILYRVNWDRMLICFQWSGIWMNYMQDIFKMTRPPNHLIWPTNDLKLPTVTWKIFFFYISLLGM